MDDDRFDDRLTAHLIAYQEQLGRSDVTLDLPPDDTQLPAEARDWLAQACACIDELVALKAEPTATGALNGHGEPGEIAPIEPSHGRRKLGRFEIRGELGSGGFGIVYQARDPRTDRLVALKIPRLESLASVELQQRFEQEARAAAKLDHPNVVSLLEAGVDGMLPYIAYAYYPGVTLAAWLKQAPGPPAPRVAARLVADLGAGLAHAHARGVLHRDIKPSNVLLVPTQDAPAAGPSLDDCIPKLLDFGLAKLVNIDDDMTRTGALLGTVRYMSPEQATGRCKSVTAAVDVYGLGAILYELLAGEPPFAGGSDLEVLRKIETAEPSRIRAKRHVVPRDLETICLKCLEKEPRRRYATVDELVDDLNHFLAGEPIAAKPVTTGERLWKWCRRNPAWAGVWGASCLGLVAFVAFLIYSNSRIGAALEGEKATRERLQMQLYAVDVRRAGEAAARKDFAHALELLKLYAKPAPEERDLREFAWHYLWNSLQGHRSFLPAHSQDVYSLSLARDGKLLATGCRDGVARVWRTADARLAWQSASIGSEVNQVAFSPAADHLAAACDDGQVRLWDSTTWSLKFTGAVGGTISTDMHGTGDLLNDLALLPDGGMIAVGWTVWRGGKLAAVARYQADGTLDDSFGTDGSVTFRLREPREQARRVAIQPDGRMVVALQLRDVDGQYDMAVSRLLPSGAPDEEFNERAAQVRPFPATDDHVYAMALLPDGRIVVAGRAHDGHDDDFALVGYSAAGEVDATFGDAGRVTTSFGDQDAGAQVLLRQSDGKLLAAGYVVGPESMGPFRRIALARYDEQGNLDTTFGNDGQVTLQIGDGVDLTTGGALQPDGKLVLAVNERSGDQVRKRVIAIRINANGTLDDSFGTAGIADVSSNAPLEGVQTLLLLPDGKIVLGGSMLAADTLEFAIARLQADGTLDRGFGTAGISRASFGEGEACVMSLACLPDGRLIAGGYARDGENRLSSQNLALARFAADGAVDSTFGAKGARGLAFSPDGRRLYAHGASTISVWDVASGASAGRFMVPANEIESLAVSATGSTLGVATRRNGYLLKAEDPRAPVQPISGLRHQVWSICFLPGSSSCVLGLDNGTFAVRNLDNGELILPEQEGDQDAVRWLRASHDGSLIAVGHENSVDVWRTDNWRRIACLKNPQGRVWDAEFWPQRQALLTSDVAGQVRQWQLPSHSGSVRSDGGLEVYSTTEPISALAISPDNAQIACGHSGGQLKVLGASAQQATLDLEAGSHMVVGVQFVGAGRGLLSAAADGAIRTFDLKTGQCSHSWSAGRSLRVVALSPRGDRLALAHEGEASISLVAWPMGRELWMAPCSSNVRSLAFSPTGRELVVSGAARLDVLNVEDGKSQASIGKAGEAYCDARLTVDGRVLIVAEGARGVARRDPRSGQLLARLLGHKQLVVALSVAGNGRNLASGGQDGTIRVWDLWTNEEVLALTDVHPAIEGAVCFSADGRLLAAVDSHDARHRVLVWSLAPSD